MVRTLKAGEVDLCQMLRLRALQDAPDAFGERYDDAINRPDQYWQKLAESLTPPSRQRMFLACDGDTYLGFVFAMLDRNNLQTGRVGGMWVDSKFRRRGIGRDLLQAAFEWAQENGFVHLKLWCEDGDVAAHRLYEKMGFVDTDKRNITRDKVDKDLVEMIWSL